MPREIDDLFEISPEVPRDPIKEASVVTQRSRHSHTNKILTVLVLLVLVALNPTKSEHRDAIFSRLTANVFNSTDNSITDLAAGALAVPLMERQIDARMARDATYVWLGVCSIVSGQTSEGHLSL